MQKILIIEDNEEVRENLSEILTLYGYQVEEAENGKIGVEKALATPPDLILCDVMMPELDGYGVLQIINQKPTLTGIPFIFLTAKTEREDLRRGMNLGADDYLTKPIYKDELIQVIQNRLAKHERLKLHLDRSPAGLLAFMDEARGHAELKKLSTDHRLRRFAKKEVLFQEGDYPRYLYFIESGKVKVYKSNDYGKELIISYLQAGDFIGYTPLINEEKAYPFAAAALEDSALRLIPAEDFKQLLFANAHVSAKMIALLANNIADKEDQLLHLAYDSIRKRVADALVQLAEKNNTTEFDILRDDLAKIVGTAKESVIRTLADFRDSGYLEVSEGRIKLRELEKLRNLIG